MASSQVGRGWRLAGPLVPAGGQRGGHGEEAAVGAGVLQDGTHVSHLVVEDHGIEAGSEIIWQ